MRQFNLAGFAAHLAALPMAIAIQQHHALERAAVIVEDRAKEKMGEYQSSSGPFIGWAELADETKSERVHQGYPENEPLLRSGILRDSIEHIADVDEAQIGVPNKTVQHPYQPKPVNIGDVAVAQELGTHNIPPRSFLGGAAAEKGPEVASILGSGVVSALIGGQVHNGRFLIP